MVDPNKQMYFHRWNLCSRNNRLHAFEHSDFNLISPVYKDDVINAYLNGITKGIDENRTFAPKSLLTRAQVCQLFYNINWVSPLEQTENAN